MHFGGHRAICTGSAVGRRGELYSERPDAEGSSTGGPHLRAARLSRAIDTGSALDDSPRPTHATGHGGLLLRGLLLASDPVCDGDVRVGVRGRRAGRAPAFCAAHWSPRPQRKCGSATATASLVLARCTRCSLRNCDRFSRGHTRSLTDPLIPPTPRRHSTADKPVHPQPNDCWDGRCHRAVGRGLQLGTKCGGLLRRVGSQDVGPPPPHTEQRLKPEGAVEARQRRVADQIDGVMLVELSVQPAYQLAPHATALVRRQHLQPGDERRKFTVADRIDEADDSVAVEGQDHPMAAA